MVSQAFPYLDAIEAELQVFLAVVILVRSPRQADARSEHRGVSQQSVAQSVALLVQVVLAALVDLLLDESQDRATASWKI